MVALTAGCQLTIAVRIPVIDDDIQDVFSDSIRRFDGVARSRNDGSIFFSRFHDETIDDDLHIRSGSNCFQRSLLRKRVSHCEGFSIDPKSHKSALSYAALELSEREVLREYKWCEDLHLRSTFEGDEGVHDISNR